MTAGFMFCRFPPIMIPLYSFNNITAIPERSDSRSVLRQFFYFLSPCFYLLIWLLLFLVCIPFQGFAQNELDVPQLSIQTQSYFHNPEEGTYLYRNAKVEWEGITVESTEILYHPDSHKLTAKGYVRVTEGEIIAVMDELEINIKDSTGIFKNTIFYDASNKAYMTAKEVRRVSKNEFVAKNLYLYDL
jgi:lipopolysaccharide assembly outer membrane protein LptD (OstA)